MQLPVDRATGSNTSDINPDDRTANSAEGREVRVKNIYPG
jgi:hypothetical protein